MGQVIHLLYLQLKVQTEVLVIQTQVIEQVVAVVVRPQLVKLEQILITLVMVALAHSHQQHFGGQQVVVMENQAQQEDILLVAVVLKDKINQREVLDLEV